jgi:hypothetical protein
MSSITALQHGEAASLAAEPLLILILSCAIERAQFVQLRLAFSNNQRTPTRGTCPQTPYRRSGLDMLRGNRDDEVPSPAFGIEEPLPVRDSGGEPAIKGPSQSRIGMPNSETHKTFILNLCKLLARLFRTLQSISTADSTTERVAQTRTGV